MAIVKYFFSFEQNGTGLVGQQKISRSFFKTRAQLDIKDEPPRVILTTSSSVAPGVLPSPGSEGVLPESSDLAAMVRFLLFCLILSGIAIVFIVLKMQKLEDLRQESYAKLRWMEVRADQIAKTASSSSDNFLSVDAARYNPLRLRSPSQFSMTQSNSITKAQPYSECGISQGEHLA